MRVLLAGGGTAGHINPALAIAEEIKKRNPNAEISFVGTPRGMESRLIPETGFDFYPLDIAGFQRKISVKNVGRNFSALYKLAFSSARCKAIINKIRPDIAIGTGGYVSGPIIRKAAAMGVKTIIHEQNAFPGVTTKLLSKSASAVLLAMPEAEKHLNLKRSPYITGNPIRESVITATKKSAREHFGMDDRPVILSFGGSLGAKRINEAIAEVISSHANRNDRYHYHATGKFGWEWMPDLLRKKGIVLSRMPQLRVTEYITDMDLCLAAADLVICRAGAITISELQAAGKASILIPSPNVAENHQFHNAKALADKGGAIIIEESELTSSRLIDEVNRLISEPQKLKEMGENAQKGAVYDAAERIYSVILSVLSE